MTSPGAADVTSLPQGLVVEPRAKVDNTHEPPVSSPELTCIASVEHLLCSITNTQPRLDST